MARAAEEGYDGKEQIYFAVQLLSDAVKLNLETTTPEFQQHRWIQPDAFKERWLPEMKRGFTGKFLSTSLA